MGRQFAKVKVIPCRSYATEQTGRLESAIPADSEAVAICWGSRRLRAHALIDQRVPGIEQQGFEWNRRTGEGQPAAHEEFPSVGLAGKCHDDERLVGAEIFRPLLLTFGIEAYP